MDDAMPEPVHGWQTHSWINLITMDDAMPEPAHGWQTDS